ncbi:hypothetical protein GCM10020331_046060 [Ectobacillus funiculus]
MDQLGGDILRLWVASVDYQSDVRISNDILKQVAEVYRKIRNTFRFLLGNLFDFKPSQHAVSVQQLREVDRYMLVKLNNLINKVKGAYETYDFAGMYHALHNFCTIDLSAFLSRFLLKIFYISRALIIAIVVRSKRYYTRCLWH